MANTYSQINIHSVFAVKGRGNIITKDFRDDLHHCLMNTNQLLRRSFHFRNRFFSACNDEDIPVKKIRTVNSCGFVPELLLAIEPVI